MAQAAYRISYIVLSILLFQSCSALRDLATNLQRLRFKLDSVNSLQIAGISTAGKKSINDFSVLDGLALTRAFASKNLPLRFTLNIAAMNPNDGSTISKTNGSATITGLDWRLLIDDVPTISGNLQTPIEVPGRGQTTMIPLEINLDLYRFLESKGYDGLVNLALALGGVQGSPARLKVDARPTVSTALGNITYPDRIVIVDKEYRN
jgi:hypothetical protein